MVKLVSDGKGKMQYLEKRLNAKGYHLPSNLADKDYRAYQQRVMTSLISRGENAEVINNFFAETDRLYSAALPSENELEWYRNDARASLWLVCELYEKVKQYRIENTVSFLSPESLPPGHNVRVEAIRRCIDEWPLLEITPKDYLKDKNIEWAELIDRHNIFRDVSSRNADVCSWLKKYIQENTPISLNRICGESPDEVIAWCCASYFMWKKNNQLSPDSVELFVRKFKSAWSTQKNRNKNKEEKKLVTMSVNISQQAHDMLRDMSMRDTMSNNAIIESAITRLYNSKNSKVHSK
ncbi:TPA: hypothetical protein R0445_004687 [Salmonella enterica subsp. enterica serovar Hvittingfoss]|nr:hypothetical protein [Salmonella enterica subsp. enterica serovar Hvittingfoss]